MPLAKDVAIELRKFADSLDKHPDVEIDKPIISFYYYSEKSKQLFLDTAKLLPRPVVKQWPTKDDGDLRVVYKSPAMLVYTSLPRNFTCELIEPAKPAVYRCDPILSVGEDESLTAEVS